MLDAFLIPFVSIFLAELLDKSQLTVFLLSTKTKKHLQLLSGVVLAFVFVDGSAIVFGSIISTFIPEQILKLASGLLFIVFGLLALKSGNSETESNAKLRNPIISGFALVFLSEWGDKTQIASGVFALRYPPVVVFFAVISALTLISIIALKAGSVLIKRVNKRTISLLSGTVFIMLGVLFLLT